MITLVEFRHKVNATVRDDAGVLPQSEKDLLIAAAVKSYSKDRPLIKVYDIPGSGSYDLQLPSDWVEGFSVIKGVEYPAGGRTPQMLEPEDYTIYQTATGVKLRMLAHLPQAGETVRLSYTTLHTAEETSSSVPAGDFDAVCHLAGALVCLALASKYAQMSEPTLGAEYINYRTRAAQYSQLAQELRKLYLEHVGRAQAEAPAASVTKDLDTTFPWGGDYLFHGKKWR